MAFQFPKDTYAGKIVEVTIGSGGKAKKVGGQNAMPLCNFEGGSRTARWWRWKCTTRPRRPSIGPRR